MAARLRAARGLVYGAADNLAAGRLQEADASIAKLVASVDGRSHDMTRVIPRSSDPAAHDRHARP
jgi:hypothetical protein